MNYQNKYLKYKNKYLNLQTYYSKHIVSSEFKNQYGGFIKQILKIEEKYTDETYSTFKTRLNEYMPLCYYDADKNNFILINNNDYILINKKINEDYQLYKMDDQFNISEISKPHTMIEDNLLIPGINNFKSGIHLIQAFQYNNNNIFRNFLSNVWTSGYNYFNRLKDIIYKNHRGQILYQNNVNIVLSLIFINKLNYILSKIEFIEFYSEYINDSLKYDFDIPEEYKIINYHVYNFKKKDTIFNKIKTNILYDYINAYDYLMIEQLKKLDTFDKLIENLNNTLSNIERLNFEDKINDFNLFIKIVRIIYTHIDEYPNLIDQYNYSLFIDKYKDFNIHTNSTTYKSLMRFINDYDRIYIKNKLILKISSLIYLCYKTNEELGIDFKTSQYMLLDYFFGIVKIKNSCIPINQRQIIINILELEDDEELRQEPITDPFEIAFYKIVIQKFKEIKQYTFSSTTDQSQYTDCGETALLNTFNYLLLKEDGTFNLTDINCWDLKLKNFYEKYPTMESMNSINLDILKKDLSLVFNGRGVQIAYNDTVNQRDINTTVENMIKTCNVLLNIDTDNFKDIFKNLNPKIDSNDVITDGNNIRYLDLFSLTLNSGHGEFNLNFNQIEKPSELTFKFYNLEDHWINLWRSRFVPLVPIYPKKYSLDHFKYYFYKHFPVYNFHFFKDYFPKKHQTEEICIEAVHPTQRLDDDEFMSVNSNNLRFVENKTPKVCQSAVSFNGLSLRYVPTNLRDKDLCRKAFENNISSIENIPREFQEKEMISKIKLMKDEKEKIRLLLFINPELL